MVPRASLGVTQNTKKPKKTTPGSSTDSELGAETDKIGGFVSLPFERLHLNCESCGFLESGVCVRKNRSCFLLEQESLEGDGWKAKIAQLTCS